MRQDCHNKSIANSQASPYQRWCPPTRLYLPTFPLEAMSMPAHVLYSADKNGSHTDSHGKIAWISFEALVAYRLLENLQTQLRRLSKKHSKKRVHDARVALRRWNAVWSQLRQNGWESKKFHQAAIKPLSSLLQDLGNTRDMDVMHDLGVELGCKRRFLRDLDQRRDDAEAALQKQLKKMAIKPLGHYMRVYLQERKYKLEKALGDTASAADSVADHINTALEQQEQLVKSLEREFDDPKGMHRFRIAVKGWRYLLSELCGIKNAELEQAQTILGDIHDLDTLNQLLLEDGNEILALTNLKQRRTKLLDQAHLIKKKLPFGLRAVQQTVR